MAKIFRGIKSASHASLLLLQLIEAQDQKSFSFYVMSAKAVLALIYVSEQVENIDKKARRCTTGFP